MFYLVNKHFGSTMYHFYTPFEKNIDLSFDCIAGPQAINELSTTHPLPAAGSTLAKWLPR